MSTLPFADGKDQPNMSAADSKQVTGEVAIRNDGWSGTAMRRAWNERWFQQTTKDAATPSPQNPQATPKEQR